MVIKQCYKTIKQVEKKNQKTEDGLTDLEEIIFNYFLMKNKYKLGYKKEISVSLRIQESQLFKKDY